jgi:hypothetical protein
MSEKVHADDFMHLAKQESMSLSPTGAARDNKGKAPLSLVPVEAMEAIALVLHKSSIPGGGKYPRNNWRKGAEYSVPLDSLLRHAFKLAGGEKYDTESGLPHSWHIICNAAFLVYYEKHYPQYNDLSVQEEQPQPAPPPPQQQGVPVNMGAILGALLTSLPNLTVGESKNED